MLSTVTDTRSVEVQHRLSDNERPNRKTITQRRKSAPPSTSSSHSVNTKKYNLSLKNMGNQVKPENIRRQLILEQGEVLISGVSLPFKYI